MLHELVHVLEAWAGVEFSEERVEALVRLYQKTISELPPEALEPTPAEIELETLGMHAVEALGRETIMDLLNGKARLVPVEEE